MNKENVNTSTEEKKVLMSDLVKERVELEAKHQTLAEEFKNTSTPVNFADDENMEEHFKTTAKKNLTALYNFLKNHAKWDSRNYMAFERTFQEIKYQYLLKRDNGWDGVIMMEPMYIITLWKLMQEMSGVGYETAHAYGLAFANIGMSLDKAIRIIDSKNQELKDIATRLNEIDEAAAGENVIHDVEYDENSLIKQKKELESKIEEEVNPTI